MDKLQALSEDLLMDLGADVGLSSDAFKTLQDALSKLPTWRRLVEEGGGGAAEEGEDTPEDGGSMSEKQVAKLKKLFMKLDKDASGALSMDELRKGLRKVAKGSVTDEELERMIAEADQDGDGQIDYEEFMAVMESRVIKQGGGSGAALGEEGAGGKETPPKDPLTISKMGKLVRRHVGQAAKVIYKKIKGKMVKVDPNAEANDSDWPEWKRKMLVDAGQSVQAMVDELPELQKVWQKMGGERGPCCLVSHRTLRLWTACRSAIQPHVGVGRDVVAGSLACCCCWLACRLCPQAREPFDIFRAKTIRKLHDRNPSMEYAYLKEMAEEMWNVLYAHEKEVYEKISNLEKAEYQKQLERREVLDYALNTLGIVDPRYLWVAEQVRAREVPLARCPRAPRGHCRNTFPSDPKKTKRSTATLLLR